MRTAYGLALIFALLSVIVVCSDKRIEIGPPGVSVEYRLLSEQQDAGYYCICWNQRTKTGDLVSPGSYTIAITAGAFNATQHFDLRASNARVVAPDCCRDSVVAAQKQLGEIPDRYFLEVDTTHYALGDSVTIRYGLPAASQVTIKALSP